jgi:tripartite motif-containing protein 71
MTVMNADGTTTRTEADYVTVIPRVLPVADFTADPVTGKAPLTVSFNDQSTGDPVFWEWSFGDGQTSGAQNPSHEYTSAGTYTITLTVTNNDGPDTKTVSVTVLAREPPVADFSASPLSGDAPLKVTFTDLSTGSPASWQWAFGDGSTSTGQSPDHEYTAPGLYTVSLTAVNPDGSDTKTMQDYITVTAPPTPPVAGFSVSPMIGRAPLSVTFTDRSTGSPDTWLWTFGDGETSDLQAPVHVYGRAGIYIARLKVTNAGGSDTAWSPIVVLPRWLWWG